MVMAFLCYTNAPGPLVSFYPPFLHQRLGNRKEEILDRSLGSVSDFQKNKHLERFAYYRRKSSPAKLYTTAHQKQKERKDGQISLPTEETERSVPPSLFHNAGGTLASHIEPRRFLLTELALSSPGSFMSNARFSPAANVSAATRSNLIITDRVSRFLSASGREEEVKEQPSSAQPSSAGTNTTSEYSRLAEKEEEEEQPSSAQPSSAGPNTNPQYPGLAEKQMNDFAETRTAVSIFQESMLRWEELQEAIADFDAAKQSLEYTLATIETACANQHTTLDDFVGRWILGRAFRETVYPDLMELVRQQLKIFELVQDLDVQSSKMQAELRKAEHAYSVYEKSRPRAPSLSDNPEKGGGDAADAAHDVKMAIEAAAREASAVSQAAHTVSFKGEDTFSPSLSSLPSGTAERLDSTSGQNTPRALSVEDNTETDAEAAADDVKMATEAAAREPSAVSQAAHIVFFKEKDSLSPSSLSILPSGTAETFSFEEEDEPASLSAWDRPASSKTDPASPSGSLKQRADTFFFQFNLPDEDEDTDLEEDYADLEAEYAHLNEVWPSLRLEAVRKVAFCTAVKEEVAFTYKRLLYWLIVTEESEIRRALVEVATAHIADKDLLFVNKRSRNALSPYIRRDRLLTLTGEVPEQARKVVEEVNNAASTLWRFFESNRQRMFHLDLMLGFLAKRSIQPKTVEKKIEALATVEEEDRKNLEVILIPFQMQQLMWASTIDAVEKELRQKPHVFDHLYCTRVLWDAAKESATSNAEIHYLLQATNTLSRRLRYWQSRLQRTRFPTIADGQSQLQKSWFSTIARQKKKE